MGFMRKALFVATGGASGVVVRANSKKDRTAKSSEQQVRIQREQLRLQKQQFDLERQQQIAGQPVVDELPELDTGHDEEIALQEDEVGASVTELLVSFMEAVPENQLYCRAVDDVRRCGKCWACRAHEARQALRDVL